MSERSVKVEIDMPGWELLDSTWLLIKMKEHVVLELNSRGLTSTDSAVNNSCKNPISRARLKKKTNILVIYRSCLLVKPLALIHDMNVYPNSSTSLNVEKQMDENNSSLEDNMSSTLPKIRIEYVNENDLAIHTNFPYLQRIFSLYLSGSCISTALSHFLDDILCYCFHSSQKLCVNISLLKQLLRRQISSIIHRAKKKATVKHQRVIKVLAANDIFSFHFSSPIVSLTKETNEFQSFVFKSFCSTLSLDEVLLIRDSDVICIQAKESSFDFTISESLTVQALKQFNISGLVNVEEIIMIAEAYFQKRSLISNIEQFSDSVKATILENRNNTSISKFITCDILIEKQEQSLDNEINLDLDTILGRTYKTGGFKRKNHCVPVDSDSSEEFDNNSNSDISDDFSMSSDVRSFPLSTNKRKKADSNKENLIRDFLHLKDEYHITDSAIKAMYRFFQDSKQPFFSMTEISRVREQANKQIPIKFTKDSAYVPFYFALRVAIYVAAKFRPKVRKLSKLVFRLNMDGTLMGNKHVVAISVNCVEDGAPCQSAKNLVPVGIFEIQKESNELLRKTLPKDFLTSIQSVKHLKISKKKYVEVKIRLGGDYQNSVYVFGLAGVHSNYPCVFCTQNKAHLYVTDQNTEYEEEVWMDRGKNKKKIKQKTFGNPTSCYDPTLGARTLQEKTTSLAEIEKTKANNKLGYQSEPLFGDLFEFSDYIIDPLHMRLRIFDILLKDILSEASRTGVYEPDHSKKLEEKAKLLNEHAVKQIGRHFFFKIESENNVKSIVSCGRFSGHLQQKLFADSFPYEIIQNEQVSKNAKNLVEKFKRILELIKTPKAERKHRLSDVSKSFVKEFLRSGLRTVCTPYMHLIGNHLAEQDENENLCAYDMQGVEKSNDLLSRLYFSSSNRAKMPLRTMIQSLYRRLEMNFADPKDRIAMTKYALECTPDETDSENECNSSHDDSFHMNQNDYNNDDSVDEICSSSDQSDNTDEDDDQNHVPKYLTYPAFTVNRGEKRWMSSKNK